jgi:uncharacterized protein involved in oxidation of intracellular sulfur
MEILIVLNDAPYGTERPYNGLRLSMTSQKEHPNVSVHIFLLGDPVTCALPNQNSPQGYYSIERMLKSVISRGGQVKACGTCSEPRGVKGLALIEGVEISPMSQLAQWTIEADRVITL